MGSNTDFILWRGPLVSGSDDRFSINLSIKPVLADRDDTVLDNILSVSGS